MRAGMHGIWREVVSNAALSCVVGVAVLLIALVFFLFLLVLSLTFDCWWTLGRFFNIDEETHCLLNMDLDEEQQRAARPWMIRLQNGKVHTVKSKANDLEMV